MGMPIKSMLFSKAAAAALANVATNTVFPSSNFSTSSGTYVDLLDATAGSPITVSLTKASASSNVLIIGEVSCLATGGNGTMTLGVNDGTADTDICRADVESNVYNLLNGAVVLTGLGAGSYTFKLRVKRGANTFKFNTAACSATITAMEIEP
jgi:hypothetical protein